MLYTRSVHVILLVRHHKSATYQTFYFLSFNLIREDLTVRVVWDTNKHDKIRSTTDHFPGCLINQTWIQIVSNK